MKEPITSGLRHYINTWKLDRALLSDMGYDFSGDSYDPVSAQAVCDAIDSVHESLEAENEMLFGEVQSLVGNEAMSSSGEWVQYPVDVDDKTIHIGDLMSDGEYVFKVDSMSLYDTGWTVCDEHGVARATCDIHHVKEPDVVDFLLEFLDAMTTENRASGKTDDEIVADYASVLMLKSSAK